MFKQDEIIELQNIIQQNKINKQKEHSIQELYETNPYVSQNGNYPLPFSFTKKDGNKIITKRFFDMPGNKETSLDMILDIKREMGSESGSVSEGEISENSGRSLCSLDSRTSVDSFISNYRAVLDRCMKNEEF